MDNKHFDKIILDLQTWKDLVSPIQTTIKNMENDLNGIEQGNRKEDIEAARNLKKQILYLKWCQFTIKNAFYNALEQCKTYVHQQQQRENEIKFEALLQALGVEKDPVELAVDRMLGIILPNFPKFSELNHKGIASSWPNAANVLFGEE